jgi:hypothetical protein
MLSLIFMSLLGVARADSNDIAWPTRNSKVICGGTVDGETLKVRNSVPGEVLTAESSNERILIFIDLHKPGQVRWLVSEVGAEKRTMDLYMGMTDGFVTMDSTADAHTFSMSCQEVAN